MATPSNSTNLKGTVMQIEKALIIDGLRISTATWKFRIPTIYNFSVIYPWTLLCMKICVLLLEFD